MIRRQVLDTSARKSLVKGVAAGFATLVAYLLVVIATTPSLPADAAVRAAFSVNSIVMGGTAGAIGAQVFFSSYGRSLGCKMRRKKAVMGAGSGTTTISSFLSFFSLVPLGCCGSWLLILSFLPSVFGSSLSVFLIAYSVPLSYAALAAVMGIAALAGTQLRRMKQNARS